MVTMIVHFYLCEREETGVVVMVVDSHLYERETGVVVIFVDSHLCERERLVWWLWFLTFISEREREILVWWLWL